MKKSNLSIVVILVIFSGLTLPAQEKTKDTRETTTMKIGMTSVFVDNADEAFKFYTEILGFVEVMYMPEMQLAIVASPRDVNGTSLLLEPNNNPIARTYQEELYKAGIPVIVFSTEDIQFEYARLKKRGVVFKEDPTET